MYQTNQHRVAVWLLIFRKPGPLKVSHTRVHGMSEGMPIALSGSPRLCYFRFMQCPACFNQLTQTQVGRLVVDVCQGGCGGIWFDAFELERVDEEEEAAGEPLLHIQSSEGLVVDRSRKRECPRCAGIKLHRHYFSAKRRVEVDQCPNCGGYWLDAGELAQIRAERGESSRTEQLRQGAVSSATIRYLYQIQSGDRKSL